MTLRVDIVGTLETVGAEARDVAARRDRAICLARDEGLSLRVIAEAVGLSHAGVKRVLDRRPTAPLKAAVPVSVTEGCTHPKAKQVFNGTFRKCGLCNAVVR